MKHRKRRIAWSVAWGIVAVLLVALWVRSYWWLDDVSPAYPRQFSIDSETGCLWGDWCPYEAAHGWNLTASPAQNGDVQRQFFTTFIDDAVIIGFPHWVPVFFFATFAGMPWLLERRWRFSLRSLLIATTLIAVGLGLIVWLAT